MIGAEQALAAERLPGHDPEAEHIGAAIEVGIRQLLRRAVGELALDAARVGLGEAHDGLGHAEVRDTRASVDAQEDVLRRDVAVHDLEMFAQGSRRFVGVVEPVRRLGQELHAHAQRHDTARLGRGLEHAPEGHADDQLHHDVERTLIVPPKVEGLDDVGTRDVGRDPRLVQEHGHEILVLGQVRQHALDGDELLKSRFAAHTGGPNLGHPTGRDAKEHLVAPHLACGRRSHRFGILVDPGPRTLIS